MAPAPNGVATGLTLDLVFVDACKAAVGGSDRCWPIVQSWRNVCCGVWALRGFPRPCACTGGPISRSAWRMCMGWPVLNWGERRGAYGMGCTDRCAALRKPNGVVSSELLEGHEAAAGLSCPMVLAFGSVGAALCQLLGRRLRQEWLSRYGAVACL
jgi:hypothetical protein